MEEQKASQHARWNSAGPGYSRWVCDTPFGPHAVWDKFAVALKGIHGGAAAVQVLDVASASGEPALTIARALGPSAAIVSTDLAEAYLELGRARAERAGLSGQVRFETADGEDLSSYSDASFDAVTCSLGLMFMPSYPTALSEMHRVLKPGGDLMVVVWQSTLRVPFFQVIFNFCHELDPVGVPLSTPNTGCKFGDSADELLGALQRVGFQSVRREEVEVAFKLPADSWWDALVELPIQLGPTLEKLKGQDQPSFYEDARRMLEERLRERGFLKPGGSMSIPGNWCNFISARK